MGIKGIYGEIGPGKRVALAKLAVEKYEQSGRPLRIAVDISIWHFQTESGRGGSNPALRTLYYRLLRLMYLSVQPIFVFDGPHKPSVKRNKQVGDNSDNLYVRLTKKLLRFFGFPFHIAPGEAEAECALLQRSGIVDAVLSEDVDTLMFGCGLTFRNWSSDEVKGNHPPSHVSVYDAVETRSGKDGLDRESMILIALMSGGDYNTAGIPGCGIKLACEAARAGFGRRLCKLSIEDKAGLNSWREELAHEIQTNEHKHFRVKHKTLKIPTDFPDTNILSLYTTPITSTQAELSTLEAGINWDRSIDIPGLRQFVAERFEWNNKRGAKKFIRGLAPALLVTQLIARANRRASGHDDVLLTAVSEMKLVKEICGRRTHFSTDGIPELRLLYIPADIVGLNLDEEMDSPENNYSDQNELGGAEEGEEISPACDDEERGAITSSPTKPVTPNYDPTQPERIWVPESIAKIGIPLKVEDYEESLRAPKTPKAKKVASSKAPVKGGMAKGALDRYMTITKSNVTSRQEKAHKISDSEVSSQVEQLNSQTKFITIASPGAHHSPNSLQSNRGGSRTPGKSRTNTIALNAQRGSPLKEIAKAKMVDLDNTTNPWTLSQSDSPVRTRQPRTKNLTSKSFEAKNNFASERQQTVISSSPPRTSGFSSNSPSKISQKHPRPITPPQLNVVEIEPSPKKSPFKKQVLGAAQISPPTPRSTRSSPSAGSQNDDASLPSLDELITSTSPCKSSSWSGEREATRSSGKSSKELLMNNSEKAAIASDGAVFEGGEQNAKKFVMLRESLEGTWKEMTKKERDSAIERRGKGRRPRMWRESEVEVLDMTSTVGLVDKEA